MSKKLRFLGYTLFISGTVLFGIMHLAIAVHIPSLGDWMDPPGKFSALLDGIFGWVPYILSIIFMILGVLFSFYDLLSPLWQEKSKI